MRFAKECKPYLIFFAILCAPAFFLNPLLVIFPSIGFCFILYFFRSPKRSAPFSPNHILSPCDGKVRKIDFHTQDSPIAGDFHVVTIFLSVFDVHINRIPISGIVKRIQYNPGSFKNALQKRALDENENNLIILETDQGVLGLRQIAGFVARHIVCYLKNNERVKQGDIFGMIKFGSGFKVYIPAHFTIKVKQGDRLCGGLTSLAEAAPCI